MAKPTVTAGPPLDLTTPIDIQQRLDDWLSANPEAQQYVTKLWYIPEGKPTPADVTHKVRLTSVSSAERALTIGLVVVSSFAVFLDLLLGMIATQPPTAAA